MSRIHDPNELATRFLGTPYASLDSRSQRVTRHLAERRPIAHAPPGTPVPRATLGQRAADQVATFGGSWTFVGIFGGTMVGWVALNAYLLLRHGRTFDPYPYILLNLFLSMLAAIQAPIILMSQNRQAEKDRQDAVHDYEVNLKAELEILLLHDKLDHLREQQWEELLVLQREQLNRLIALGVPHPS
jgi:uncharacterized membrane protein